MARAKPRAAATEVASTARAKPPAAAKRARAAALTLPDDVLPLVLVHLDGWQLSRCVAVCRTWRALICGADDWWRRALAADFVDGLPACTLARQGILVPDTHATRARRVPSALRHGHLKHALSGLQAMRRNRDVHVLQRVQRLVDAVFNARVHADVVMAVEAALGRAAVQAAAPATLRVMAELRAEAAKALRSARRSCMTRGCGPPWRLASA